VAQAAVLGTAATEATTTDLAAATTGNNASKGIKALSMPPPPLPPRSRSTTRGGLYTGRETKRREDQRKVSKEATLNTDQLKPCRTLSDGSSNSSTEAPPKKRIGTTDDCDESQDNLMWEGYDGEKSYDKENSNTDIPLETDRTNTEDTVTEPAAADHAVDLDTNVMVTNTPREAAAPGAEATDKTIAMEESSQDSTKWDGTSSDNDRTLQALEANEAVLQPWSEEGSGDLVVAPEATIPEEFEAAKADNEVEKMDDTASGRQIGRYNTCPS
jgi:hypothetical protein